MVFMANLEIWANFGLRKFYDFWAIFGDSGNLKILGKFAIRQIF